MFFGEELDASRVKKRFAALYLFVMPASLRYSDWSFSDWIFKYPFLALELSKRYKSNASVIAVYIAYGAYQFYSLNILIVAFNTSRDYFSYQPVHRAFEQLLLASTISVVGVIFLVVPALAATSVVGERRRGTLMLVQLSLLRPFEIVWGKVIVSITPILFPVGVCVVTLFAFSLWMSMDVVTVYRFFGGAIAGVALVVLSVVVSVVCVLCSTFAKSTAAAIGMSYGLLFSMIVMMTFIMPMAVHLVANFLDVSYDMERTIVVGLSLLVCVVGLPFVFLWACRRLRLPAKK